MSSTPDTVDRAEDGEDVADTPDITSLRATDERTVFTERGNTDGWIATDLTVDCRE